MITLNNYVNSVRDNLDHTISNTVRLQRSYTSTHWGVPDIIICGLISTSPFAKNITQIPVTLIKSQRLDFLVNLIPASLWNSLSMLNSFRLLFHLANTHIHLNPQMKSTKQWCPLHVEILHIIMYDISTIHFTLYLTRTWSFSHLASRGMICMCQ